MSGLETVIGQFHAFLLTEKRVSTNTFYAYKRDLEQFDSFLHSEQLDLVTISKKHIVSFLKMLKDQGLGAKTLSRKISSLKIFFRFLFESNKIEHNITQTVVFPKIEKTLPTYLTEQEIEKLLDAANKDSTPKGIRNKVMVYVLYATGMRVSELVSITVEQIHFDTGFISVMGKGSKERMIPVPQSILDLVHYYLDHVYAKLIPSNAAIPNGKRYLFAAAYGNKIKPISRQTFWLLLKKILARAAIFKNISPHSLRHSLATHLLQKGADLRSLQILLGHQNLATVQVYTHVSNPEIRKVYDKKHPRA